MNREILAERLRATFLVELEEQLRLMNTELLALENAPGDVERLKALFRVAHTLKGAARAAGVSLIEEASHALETVLLPARDGTRPLTAAQIALLFQAADALADAGERMREGRELSGSPLARLCASLNHAEPMAAPLPPPLSPPLPPQTDRRRGEAQPERTERGDVYLRIQAEKIDAVFASAAQLSVAAARIEERRRDLHDLEAAVKQKAQRWRRARRRLHANIERTNGDRSFARLLQELDDDLRQLEDKATRLTAGASTAARAVAQVTAETVDRVYRLRTRPFADACEALPRVVHDIAGAEGKDVDLEIRGADAEADRVVLDGLREAIHHLVRNAIDHGIEPPAFREAAGKPRRGTVRVGASVRGHRIIVEVADDGTGLDIPAIRDRLQRLGRRVPEDEHGIAKALFEGGLSTRSEATTISGRGVGLDLVRSAVDRINGVIDVDWRPGHGTRFTMECPVTLATMDGVVAVVGGQAMVIPTASVQRLARIAPAEIKRAEGRAVISTPDGPVPLVALARLLGPPLVEKVIAGRTPVVLLHVGTRRLGLTVDEVVAEQELVVRPLVGGGRALPHLSGAAILASGEVALVINALTVLDTGLGSADRAGPSLATTPATMRRPRILVVDDSITTRTLEQSVLEAAGYDVSTAIDGAEAWKVLQEADYDLVLADVEMPRMDGFELCEAVRASKRLKELPVVLVTALETAEHRARGLEAGADAYIGKSSFDQQHLLDAIRQLLG